MSEGPPSRTRAASSYNRRRAGNACLVCRSRKTKCDNQRPVCGFCAATGGECRYLDSDPSQFDRASLAILQRLSELESTLVDHIDNSFNQQQIQNVGFTRSTNLPSHESPSTVDWRSRSSHQITGQTPSWSQEVRENDLHPDLIEDRPPTSKVLLQASEMFSDSVLKWPIFSQAAPQLEKELNTPILEVWTQFESADQTYRPNSANKGGGFVDLDASMIYELVENFLANNHIKNPIFDTNLLRAYAREVAETGPQWDERSCLIVSIGREQVIYCLLIVMSPQLLVCAVSSISAPLDQEREPGPSMNRERLAMAESYFQASQRRIGMLYHQTSLVVAQCSFLTGVYLMSTMQILPAWKCFVQAGTQCLVWLTSNGRMKGTNNRIPVEDGSRANYAEESLYWSCLKSEL